MRYFVLFVFLATGMLHSASIAEIEKSIASLRTQPGMKHAISALSILNTKTGETLFEENQEFSLTPASLMKVITTGAALHLLGPELRFETELVYEGTIDSNGVLHGNIVLNGGGDPTLGSSEFPGVDSWEKQIDHWIQVIKNLGVKTIAGSVVGDGSVYESHFISSSWMVEDVGNYYGAGASGLSFHDNQYELTLKPGPKVGENTEVMETVPPLPFMSFENEVLTGNRTSGDQAYIYGSEYGRSVILRGTIPLGFDHFTIRGAILDPPYAVAHLLYKELVVSGIPVQKGASSARHHQSQYNCRTIVDKAVSPTLKEIIYWTNKKSQNLYAEHLLKKLGDGSSKLGIARVKRFWRSRGVDLEGFAMHDGCGASRKNLLTTTQMVSILKVLSESSLFPYFYDSLPIASEDGTLANVLTNIAHANQIRAKTGSMSQVKNYAGYFRAENGDLLAFALITNQCSSNAKKRNMNLEILLSNLIELDPS